jgi:hypothetical protein
LRIGLCPFLYGKWSAAIEGLKIFRERILPKMYGIGKGIAYFEIPFPKDLFWMRRDQIKKKTVRSTKKREIGLVKNGSTEPSLRMSAWTREVSTRGPRMYPMSRGATGKPSFFMIYPTIPKKIIT